ncbi:hypothetical protein [Asticcacaulis benevestitus]|uniref:Uncharacterized protein n=1 Tax=Asticcacaulis benevestitus DSM 16100 = ATCC BAA-896 TaxID=1121022 RepID=V4PE90_9CAUL|nr:hypothetical protein [Asticcacaulis benevestitus]ESQ85469.1 hypothetical protein ABENE_18925 [Asticcacaulis benevestitus DSM 16100 = ATCC BAA-896]
MSLNADFIFETRDITTSLKRDLGLPQDVWYLVLDANLDHAYFMNTQFELHEHTLAGDVRPVVEAAVRNRIAPARSELPYRHYEGA